jgi:hypothetical protein
VYTAGKATCYGRVIGLTIDPDRPFVFDQGFVPMMSDGDDDWRFAFGVRVIDVSMHPAGGVR